MLTDWISSGIFRERPAPGAVEKRSLGLRLDGTNPAEQRLTVTLAGGMLAVTRCPDPVLQVPCALLLFFDNGRGDITELADPVTGAAVAHYECSPFGKPLVSSGPLADANPYRFSSKEHDATALVYYGYRYYSPELGRWINRDPIGERGGLNLGTICGNSPVNGIDPLGLAESSESCGECCCCVRDLYWSAINRYESADLTVIGHEISMTAKIEKKRKISPADGGACKFEWWEITNEPAAEWILQGVLPNVERDLFDLNSSYFSDWTVRYADIPCPGSGGADSFDKPKANTTRHYQVVNMRIRVKVTSTCSSCPGSREIVFKQHLELTPKQGLWKKSWSLPEPMLRGNDNPPGPFPYP